MQKIRRIENIKNINYQIRECHDLNCHINFSNFNDIACLVL